MGKVSQTDVRPPYVQIADDLRTSIDTGALKPGEKLASGRDLAHEYGVAPMTVQRALQVLRDEGRIIAWQGRGVFVAEDLPVPRDDAALAAKVDALTKTVDQLAERVTRLERDA